MAAVQTKPVENLALVVKSLTGSEITASEDTKTFLQTALKQTKALLECGKSQAEIEECFLVLTDSALTLDEDASSAVLANLLDSIMEGPESAAKLRLRILANVFNKLPAAQAAVRFNFFNKIVDLGANSGQLKLLYSYLMDVESIFDEGELSLHQKRSVFLKISNVLEDAQGYSMESLKFLYKYLSAYEGANKDEISESKAAAVRAVMKVVKNPVEVFAARINLCSLQAIQQLKSDAKSAAVYELLEIFTSKSLKEYMEFCTKNKDLFKTHAIEHDECVSNMRLISLCTLANRAESISFGEIMSLLQIEQSEVEPWIVRAIASGLIQAKVDQVSETVVIASSVHRQFSSEEWKELSTKLQTWKKNVASFLTVIREAKNSSN